MNHYIQGSAAKLPFRTAGTTSGRRESDGRAGRYHSEASFAYSSNPEEYPTNHKVNADLHWTPPVYWGHDNHQRDLADRRSQSMSRLSLDTTPTSSPASGGPTRTTRFSERPILTSRSLSFSQAASHRSSLFAPLPEYAMYQERKIQRALSRAGIFNNNTRYPIRRRASWGDSVPHNNTTPASPCSSNSRNIFRNHHAYTTTTPRRASCGSVRSLMRDGALYCPTLDAEPEPLPPRPKVTRRSNSDPELDLSNHSNSSTGPTLSPCNSRQESCSDPRKEISENTIEIAPGIKTRLRSANDTVAAIRNGFYTSLTCYGCDITVYCIADSKYCICQSCRIISPLQDLPFAGERLERDGLGIGLNQEELATLQFESLELQPRQQT